jgi:hypothetical protein
VSDGRTSSPRAAPIRSANACGPDGVELDGTQVTQPGAGSGAHRRTSSTAAATTSSGSSPTAIACCATDPQPPSPARPRARPARSCISAGILPRTSSSPYLKQALDGDTLGTLASKIGVDPDKAKSAIGAALPTIVSALAKNTKSDEGAAKLDKALDEHDAGIASKLAVAAPDLLSEGQKILGHVFGKKQQTAEKEVAKAASSSGFDVSKVGDLLATLAPLVLSALNQKKKEEGLDAKGMAESLQADGVQAKKEAGGALSFLDADGDGDIMDDIADKGAGLFGGGGGEKKG